MGVFEYLRKCVASITGRDPEETDSSALYRFYSQTTSGQMGLPTRGTVPFKHSVASPMQMSPGLYYSSTGQVTAPHLYDATMGDAIRVLPMYAAGSTVGLGAYTANLAGYDPNLTVGGANTTLGTSFPDEWKWASVSGTLVGGSVSDVELIATKAGVKFQVVITDVAVEAVTGDNMVPIRVTIQDSDNVQLSGSAMIAVPCFFKTQIGMATNRASFPWMGCVCYSATANRAIEMDVAGGAGTEKVVITFAYREFA